MQSIGNRFFYISPVEEKEKRNHSGVLFPFLTAVAFIAGFYIGFYL